MVVIPGCVLSFRSKDSFSGHRVPSYKRCQNHCAESSQHAVYDGGAILHCEHQVSCHVAHRSQLPCRRTEDSVSRQTLLKPARMLKTCMYTGYICIQDTSVYRIHQSSKPWCSVSVRWTAGQHAPHCAECLSSLLLCCSGY